VQLQEQAPLVLLVLPGLPAVDQVALAHTHELLEQRRTRRDHPVRRALSMQRGGGGCRAPCRFLPLASLLPVPAVLSVQSIQPLEPLDSTLSWPRLHVAFHVRRHLGCRQKSPSASRKLRRAELAGVENAKRAKCWLLRSSVLIFFF